MLPRFLVAADIDDSFCSSILRESVTQAKKQSISASKDDQHFVNYSHLIQFQVVLVILTGKLKVRIIASWSELGRSHDEEHVRGKFEEELVKPLVPEWHRDLNRQ